MFVSFGFYDQNRHVLLSSHVLTKTLPIASAIIWQFLYSYFLLSSFYITYYDVIIERQSSSHFLSRKHKY